VHHGLVLSSRVPRVPVDVADAYMHVRRPRQQLDRPDAAWAEVDRGPAARADGGDLQLEASRWRWRWRWWWWLAGATGRRHYVPVRVHKLTIDDAHGRGAMKLRNCGPLCAQ
jgi:hypothetical protein